MTNTSGPLERALEYAAQGWPVFPCRSADEFDSDTGEVLPEKSPLISNGFRGATLNERLIRELWKRNPDAVIGVPTGERIDAWVLDLDLKTNANGREWLAEIEAANDPLPDTMRVATANGGEHIFFKYVPGVRNRGRLGAGVDVRGEGGFVVGAGSVMADGREYRLLNDHPVADAPDWLLALVLPPPPTETRSDYHYEPGENQAYVERAMEYELSELASTQPGNRGYQLNASAFSIGQLVGAGAVSRDEAEHGLYAAAVSCGVVQKDGEREARAKIRRGLDSGIRQPRNIPEPIIQQDNTRLIDVKRMIANGLAKAATEPDPPPEPPAEATEEPAQAEPEPEGDPIFRATPFDWLDPTKLPRREFAYGTHYIRKYVSVTVSPGGIGKTSNSIVEALAMTSARALTEDKASHKLRVWIFNAEDPREEMERRIMAACIHYGLKREDFEGRLFMDTGREQELVIMHEDKKAGVKINAPIVEAVVEQIKRNEIDVMIIDPFVSTHRVNENDNGAIDRVAKLWAQIADDTNCAIDVVHHLRKLADREATVEDARGAVSLIGAARSVRVLNRMSEEQATKANLAPDERFSYFSIQQGKANLTRVDNSQHWRRLESVPLGNGRGMAKPQDHAGVVTKWKWPSKEEIADAVPTDVKRAVLVKLQNQDYRESDQAGDWAGYVLADAMGVHLEVGRAMTAEKRKIKIVLESWIANGILEVAEEEDKKHIGRTVKYVRPAVPTT